MMILLLLVWASVAAAVRRGRFKSLLSNPKDGGGNAIKLPLTVSDNGSENNGEGNDIHLFINGTIYGSSVATVVEAFAVDDATGRIVAIGSTADILSQFPTASSIFDFHRQTVTPGFTEGHAHMMSLGTSLLRADLNAATSEEECIAILRPYYDSLPDGATWLLARGWDNNRWSNTAYPTKHSLDEAFGPAIYIYLTRVDGHAAWVNSAALSLADLPDDDPQGGQIIRDENGEPTGVLIDTAMNFVSVHIPPPTEAEEEAALELAVNEVVKYGITSHHDAGADEAFVNRVMKFIDEGRFPLRIYVMIYGTAANWCDRQVVDYGGRMTLRSTKLMLDGALGSYGAAMIEPYSDAPDQSGTIIIPYPVFVSTAQEWIACGWQVNTHAIGDQANRNAVYGYRQALRNLGISDGSALRLRVEHAQIIHPDDFDIFAEEGFLASYQPTHGPERILGAYAWKTMLNLSVHVVFGSDFPVEPVNPLIGFYSAVTRMAFTLTAAYGAFQENDLGSIDVGKRADFVVLDRDIMTVADEAEILATTVLFTFVDGTVVYQRQQQQQQ